VRADALEAWRATVLTVGAAIMFGRPAAGQDPFRVDRTFSFYAENDALGGKTDRSYTNGVRVTWDFSLWNRRFAPLQRMTSLAALIPFVNPRAVVDACAPREGREGRRCGTSGLGIGQTLYSPNDIVDTLPRPRERPYAGLLFASASLTTLYERWQVGSELVIGVMGPWSHGESAQSLAHWSFSTPSAKPRGWRHQLRNAPVIGLVNTYAVRPAFGEWCRTPLGCNGGYGENRVIDVTPRAELALGTHMTRASGGAIVRAGWRFPDVVGQARIPTTAGRTADGAGAQPWFALFYSIDSRYVARNAFLTGTGADRNAGEWNDIREISPSRGVRESAAGFTGGLYNLSLTFQMVDRSREYRGDQAHHRFGALTVSLFTARSAR
jgi:hypothetical protein